VGETYALFHVAAGRRLGYGHLRRATTIAAVLERPVALHVRGSADVPPDMCRVDGTPPRVIDTLRPRVLVVDDPRAEAAKAWVQAARRHAVPAVSLHDLGLAPVASDLAIDGSLVTRRRWPSGRTLLGPRYAIAGRGPAVRRKRVASEIRTVALSLGGGNHHRSLRAIAGAIRHSLPGARVLVAAGLHQGRRRPLPAGVVYAAAQDGLCQLLQSVDLAVLGGGTSLYEAANAGVPVVGVPMVPAQGRTVRAFDRAGVAMAAGRFTRDPGVRARQVARALRALALDAPCRRRMARRGPAMVDGRGAQRVADAIRSIVEVGDV
jgi:spore coat polysaccharide biosynthesis predicted glycosyltransferase SpsG